MKVILKKGYEDGEKKDIDIHSGILSLHLMERVDSSRVVACMYPSLRSCSCV